MWCSFVDVEASRAGSLMSNEAEAPLFFDDAGSEPRAHVPAKRGASDDADTETVWHRRYLGTFVICGYSMTKGSGYLQQGERVRIQRKSKTKSASPAKGARAKARPDYVVRFSNARGTSCKLTQALRSVVFLWTWQAGWLVFLMSVYVSWMDV